MENVDDSVLVKQGAEAKIFKGTFLGQKAIFKLRFSKSYRHEKLDETLTKDRLRAEARALLKCRSFGLHVPAVYFVDLQRNCIVLEDLDGAKTVRECIEDLQGQTDFTAELTDVMRNIGATVATLHRNHLIHGDLTTSNMMLQRENTDHQPILYLIDFGLSHVEPSAEDKAVDLYVLERAFLSTHPNTDDLFQVILQAYSQKLGSTDVLKKLDEVRARGRKRTMVG